MCGGGGAVKGGDNPKNDTGHRTTPPPPLHTLGGLFLGGFYAPGQIKIRAGGMEGLTGTVGVGRKARHQKKRLGGGRRGESRG